MSGMMDTHKVVSAAFTDQLTATYKDMFPHQPTNYAAHIKDFAVHVLGHLNACSAAYHNAEHTILVTLAGQAIMQGRLRTQPVEPRDWAHYMAALLSHDIGYCRDVCEGDTSSTVITGADEKTMSPPSGASDASLAPIHVDRGILFVRAHFAHSDLIDAERVVAAVDFTRFPVPTDPRYAETASEPALVRAADLIGQLADPFYLHKINKLHCELDENGTAAAMGYNSALDMERAYPEFFRDVVLPLIGPALEHLDQTEIGKRYIKQLHENVAAAARDDTGIGPFRGAMNVSPVSE